jgi:hypothetical protein
LSSKLATTNENKNNNKSRKNTIKVNILKEIPNFKMDTADRQHSY